LPAGSPSGDPAVKENYRDKKIRFRVSRTGWYK
jgi:hypothetical protein